MASITDNGSVPDSSMQVGPPTEKPPEYSENMDPPPYQPGYNISSADNIPPSASSREPPPSYESIFGQVRAAKEESSTMVEFFKKLAILLLGTWSMFIHDCPVEKHIPIYLIVAGVVGVVKNISNMVQRARNKQNETEDQNAKTNPVDSLLNCFLLAWFIAGNVWIYRTHGRFTTDPNDHANYCHPTLYWFAFWVTTATYIIMGLTCLCICCGGLLAGVMGVGRQQQDQV